MIRLDVFLDHSHPAVFPDCTGVIVNGLPKCGKSSFAFQAAMNVTSHGGTALVLCHEDSLMHKMPCPRSAMDKAHPSQLQRIEFTYCPSLAHVRRACAELPHQYNDDDGPLFILVEDDGLSDSRDVCSWVKTMAVLNNTVEWLRPRVGARNVFFAFVTNNCFAGTYPLHCGPPLITVHTPTCISVESLDGLTGRIDV